MRVVLYGRGEGGAGMNYVERQNRINILKDLLKLLDGAIVAIIVVLSLDLLCRIALAVI